MNQIQNLINETQEYEFTKTQLYKKSSKNIIKIDYTTVKHICHKSAHNMVIRHSVKNVLVIYMS